MWNCSKCNEEVEDEFDICWNCNTTKDGVSIKKYATTESLLNPLDINGKENEKRNVEVLEKDKKYPALRIISGVYYILAWIVIIFTLFCGFVFAKDSIALFFVIIVIGAIVSISLLAFSEGIKVFIDIEENTRLNMTRRNRNK